MLPMRMIIIGYNHDTNTEGNPNGGRRCFYPYPMQSFAVCTRRGDVWIIENPSMANGGITTTLKNSLQVYTKPLGLSLSRTKLFIPAQRGGTNQTNRYERGDIADDKKLFNAWPCFHTLS